MTDPERIYEAHRKAAIAVGHDPVYVPIFERLDQWVREHEASKTDDPVARARLIAQSSRAA